MIYDGKIFVKNYCLCEKRYRTNIYHGLNVFVTFQNISSHFLIIFYFEKKLQVH